MCTSLFLKPFTSAMVFQALFQLFKPWNDQILVFIKGSVSPCSLIPYFPIYGFRHAFPVTYIELLCPVLVSSLTRVVFLYSMIYDSCFGESFLSTRGSNRAPFASILLETGKVDPLLSLVLYLWMGTIFQLPCSRLPN